MQAHGTSDTSETAQANVLTHLCCLLYLNTPQVRQLHQLHAPPWYRLTNELKLTRSRLSRRICLTSLCRKSLAALILRVLASKFLVSYDNTRGPTSSVWLQRWRLPHEGRRECADPPRATGSVLEGRGWESQGTSIYFSLTNSLATSSKCDWG